MRKIPAENLIKDDMPKIPNTLPIKADMLKIANTASLQDFFILCIHLGVRLWSLFFFVYYLVYFLFCGLFY